VCDPDEVEQSRWSGRRMAFGATSTGKYLACVYELLDDTTVLLLIFRNGVQVAVRDAFRLLKAERQARGLSLSDVEKKTGIGRSALSRLENETEPNPTVVTLTRYAEALGKELVVSFK